MQVPVEAAAVAIRQRRPGRDQDAERVEGIEIVEEESAGDFHGKDESSLADAVVKPQCIRQPCARRSLTRSASPA